MGEEDSRLVLPTPEMHLTHTLRPWEGFEATYQGQATTTPIYLCESNKPIDAEARKGLPGIDPNLVSGIPVRLGTRTAIWLPMLLTTPGFGVGAPYIWQIEWRLRNCYDHRNTPEARMPFHFPKQGQGTPETLGPHPGARVIIPASFETQVYVQTEPVLMSERSYVHLRPVQIQIGNRVLSRPLNPGGEHGVVEQGVYPSSPGGSHTRPHYGLYETQSSGDEVILSLWRDPALGANWDFAGLDEELSKYFGIGSGAQIRDLGVYVMYGVTP
jgi:hypothetical protein